VHRIRVRYGECDMQGVVFNAHYLAYVDDAADTWFRERLGQYEDHGFDCMVKKATIEWASPARFGDELDLAVRASRWGRTSFDIEVTGTVGDRPVFVATVVYVSTTPGSPTPLEIPESVKAALSG
jgi:acyl-CoA thioester hydrolase